MNLSNKLTVLRIFLVPIFILFLETEKIPNNFLFALIVFIIAALTDLFDGKIARKRHQITDFGKFLDPLADKILTLSAFMCFIEMNLISAIPVIIIMAREFAVTSVRLIAATQNKVIAANNLGKVKTVIQIFSIGIIIFLQIKPFIYLNSIANNLIISGLVWLCAVITAVSGIVYVKNGWDFIKTAK